jgi:DNA-binding NarL/FixJ family response regulator
MNETKIRVVIIEDHPVVRERLSELVSRESDMEICGEADTAQAGAGLVVSLRPDMIILDITLKSSSGLELIKSLRALSISTPILVLSMHEESLYAQRALRAGASGYINKNSPSSEVIKAVRQLLEGKIYLSGEMTENVLQNLTQNRSANRGSASVDRLSDREIRVLEMIGRGRAPRVIAETLGVGVATVETYRARIKEKMNLQNAFELQHFAIRWVREREE